MASTVYIFRTICFTLVQLIILNIVNCEFLASHHNATNYESPGESNRQKRFLCNTLPFILRLRVQNPMENPFDLRLVQKESYLANEYLPVVTNGFKMKTDPKIMADIGEFIMYHDAEQCSAVVYFVKLNILRGVIGTNLFINNLPFDFDCDGNYRLGSVGHPFIMKYKHPYDHIFPTSNSHLPINKGIQKYSTVSRAPNSNRGSKRPSDSDPGPSSKHQRPKRTHNGENHDPKYNSSGFEINYIRKRRESNPRNRYLEILVFITHDIAEKFKNFFKTNEYIQWIVRYYIVYFNAIDMMFRQLLNRHHFLYINIAKIVIQLPLHFEPNNVFRFTGIYDKLPEYLQTHSNYYPPDSLDYIFISTTHLTTDPSSRVHGQTIAGMDIYLARKNNDFYGAIPISLVEYYYSDYLIAVHEVAKIFNLNISSPDREIFPKGQCYGIMQEGGPKCDSCLKWMNEDRDHILTFFKENPNRCFLMNEPRSMRPPGPYLGVSYARQCSCFLYPDEASRDRKYVRECAKPSICYLNHEKNTKNGISTIFPFDGTKCGRDRKVCWKGQCVPFHK